MDILLRPYQREFLDDVVSQWKLGVKRVCGVMPTGAGKTIAAARLITEILRFNNHTIFWLTHRRELIFQVSKVLSSYDIPHSFIAAGKPYDANAKVFICSVPTLVRKPIEKLPQPNLIIADEIHLSAAKQFKQCILQYDCKALGLTATPIRLDKKPLGEIFDSMVHGPSTLELIKSEHLAYPRIFVPPKTANLVMQNCDNWHTIGGDYKLKDLENFFSENAPAIYGDVITHIKQYLYNKPTLVFCSSVAHVYKTVDAFNEAGLVSAGLDGTMSDHERQTVLDDFNSGKIFYLMSNQLLVEGIDLVNAAGIALLRPTESLTVYLQSCGRGMRRSDTKSECIILDHVNLTDKFGPMFIARQYTLDKFGDGGTKRDTISSATGQLCLNCGFTSSYKAKVCYNCGKAFKKKSRKSPKVLKESLQEITPDTIEKQDRERILATEKEKLDALLKEKQAKERFAQNKIFSYGTLEQIAEHIKKTMPKIDRPTAYAIGIIRRRDKKRPAVTSWGKSGSLR